MYSKYTIKYSVFIVVRSILIYSCLINDLIISSIQLTLLNTATGELGQLVTNLMDYDLEFSCQDDINACDLWRVTAWDATNSIMYFQAHSTAGDNAGEPMLAMMGVDHTQRGKLSWYVNTLGKLQFGLSGFQFVEFK